MWLELISIDVFARSPFPGLVPVQRFLFLHLITTGLKTPARDLGDRLDSLP
jgi:hypothetical protein